MGVSVGRRKLIADRLRKIAAEEEALGAKEVAADFRRRARELEAGRTLANEVDWSARPAPAGDSGSSDARDVGSSNADVGGGGTSGDL
jgi:hypothetical protein